MQKRILWPLILCLTIGCCIGFAGADEPSRLIVDAPEIVYDGAILRISVKCTPSEDGIALVDSIQLDPGMADNKEFEDALAHGWDVMGVHCEAAVFSGQTKLNDYRVFSNQQDDRSIIKGFFYLLPPSLPQKDMTVRMEAELQDAEGTIVEYIPVQVPVPDPIEAESFTIPTDIALEGVRLEEVFVSSSKEAFCVFLYCDGESYADAALSMPESGETHAALFTLNEDFTSKDMRWTMFFFEPVQAKPVRINLALYTRLTGEEAAALQVDLFEGDIALLN
ncbi:MAG: hypothetical protein FWF69_06380 [Firmicutes bacterium]|nr:hypothetical protein [Bacillota bacterium]